MIRGLWLLCWLLPTADAAPASPRPPVAEQAVSSLSRRIDERVAQACAAEGIEPASVCDDATFLRRVWLDLAGRVPPLEETRRLLPVEEDVAEPAKLDRAAVVDGLLKSKEFAGYWGSMWVEYLTDRRPYDTQDYDGRLLLRSLRDAFAANTPYDKLVADLIQGDGASDTSGSANFLLRYAAEPGPLAGAVGRKFLGLTIQCAECHNHPHASWTKDDFWGLAAYFGRLRRMNPNNPPEGENFVIVIERPRGELLLVDKQAKADADGQYPMRTVFPRLPGSTRTDTSKHRRAALINWVTSPENPYFARHGANEIWFRLTGARLVDTLDKLPKEDGSLAAGLLEDLRASFVASRFDTHALIRGIVLSDTYQRGTVEPTAAPSVSPALAKAPSAKVTTRIDTAKADTAKTGSRLEAAKTEAPKTEAPKTEAAKTVPAKKDAPKPTDSDPVATRSASPPSEAFRLSRAIVRPLSADQLHLSLASASGYHFDDNDHRLATATGEEFTYDQPVNSFSDTPASLRRSLALFNSDHVRGATDVLAETTLRVHGPSAGAEHIRRLFAALLTRVPRPDELEAFLSLAGGDSPKVGLEDVVWVIVNSAEFGSNH